MRRAVTAKFEQITDLRAELFRTGRATLVEASLTDMRWGIGLDKDDPDVANPIKWRGQNLLGQVLMAVRTSLSTQFPEEFERQKQAAERYYLKAIPT